MCSRNLGQDAVELLHLRAAADDMAGALVQAKTLAQGSAGAGCVQTFRDAIEHCSQFFNGEGLGEIVSGTHAHRLNGRLHRGGRVHDEYSRIRLQEFDFTQQSKTFPGWYFQFKQDDVKSVPVQKSACFRSSLHLLRKKPHFEGDFRAGSASGRILIDDEEMQLASARHWRSKVCHS